MFSIPQRYIQFTGYMLVVAITTAIALSSFHAGQKALVVSALEERFVGAHTTLLELTEFTARNDATTDIKSLTRDCPLRAEYEAMLSTLHNNLSLSEIQRATNLYDACGDFFALRKRLMVMRMESVFRDMTTYADLYATYTKSTKYQDYLLSAWKPILAMEAERAHLLSEQVVLQGTIIRSLPGRQKQQLDT